MTIESFVEAVMPFVLLSPIILGVVGLCFRLMTDKEKLKKMDEAAAYRRNRRKIAWNKFWFERSKSPGITD